MVWLRHTNPMHCFAFRLQLHLAQLDCIQPQIDRTFWSCRCGFACRRAQICITPVTDLGASWQTGSCCRRAYCEQWAFESFCSRLLQESDLLTPATDGSNEEPPDVLAVAQESICKDGPIIWRDRERHLLEILGSYNSLVSTSMKQ
ncbi:hypothetical protein POJ06DRAFT_69291 [Lipomyces tetrasporus]|uniref:Uncharacterized protein n=1 Tax=Lipomyces tetrasporus TaxID=54092 RepID=A0AAD7QUL3_9ASCO|nr:uncharacterized protein POJ06DRAFT_69291 [Lipomyces tetrasporus]KAJ8101685.1 hypothetical protein POJ06DRAFT_69291 [Lipomyces tetrasporus]